MGSQQPNQSQSSQKGGPPSQQQKDSHSNSSRAGEDGTDMPSDTRPDSPDGAQPDRARNSNLNQKGGQQPSHSGK